MKKSLTITFLVMFLSSMHLSAVVDQAYAGKRSKFKSSYSSSSNGFSAMQKVAAPRRRRSSSSYKTFQKLSPAHTQIRRFGNGTSNNTRIKKILATPAISPQGRTPVLKQGGFGGFDRSKLGQIGSKFPLNPVQPNPTSNYPTLNPGIIGKLKPLKPISNGGNLPTDGIGKYPLPVNPGPVTKQPPGGIGLYPLPSNPGPATRQPTDGIGKYPLPVNPGPATKQPTDITEIYPIPVNPGPATDLPSDIVGKYPIPLPTPVPNPGFPGDFPPPGNDPPGNDPPGNDPPGNDPPGNDPPGNDPPGNDPPGNDPPPMDDPHDHPHDNPWIPFPWPLPPYGGGICPLPVYDQVEVYPQDNVVRADLEVIDIRMVDPGIAQRNLGPRYRVWVRNISRLDVGTFQVLLLAGAGSELAPQSPRATADVEIIRAGQMRAVDIRLPWAAMQMAQNAQSQSGPFTSLVVVVDSLDQVAEIDERNNVGLWKRAEVKSVDMVLQGSDRNSAPTGSQIVLMGEGFDLAAGQVWIEVAGLKLQAEVTYWHPLAVRVRLPKLQLTQAVNIKLSVVRADGQLSQPVMLRMDPS